MKHPTKSFQNLKRSVVLAKQIVSRVPTTTISKPAHSLKVRSYIVLLHAALEEYLESVSQEMLEASLDLFKSQQTLNAVLYSAICYYKTRNWWHLKKSTEVTYDALLVAASQVLDKHREALGDIHGIKKKHQKLIFEPIGFDFVKSDPTLASSLESFGEKRGGVAHKMSITTVHTRSSIDADIKAMMAPAKIFDHEFCKIFKAELT